MNDNGKKYKVLQDGITQVVDGVSVARTKGSFIALTDRAAEHLVADGLVEEAKSAAKKGATK
jgi:hypothetical protein